MPRLIIVPPNPTYTNGPDLVTGEESGAFPAIGMQVLSAGVIDTLAGNDTVEGTGTGSDGVNPSDPGGNGRRHRTGTSGPAAL